MTDDRASGYYIKDDIRQIKIKQGDKGLWYYFLPPYKVDEEGHGVWFRIIHVRKQFGSNFKFSYVVDSQDDPARHFEKRFKKLYPDESKPFEGEDGFKVYPDYGYVSRRVLYNVVYAEDLEKGTHVLDLPQYNGADVIDKYLKTERIGGKLPRLICDPEGASPVFIQLNKGKKGNPWQIEVNGNSDEACELPVEFTDTDEGYIYNLDDVIETREKEWVIDILRDSFPPDVFSECMAGYDGFEAAIETGNSNNPVSSKPPTPPKPPSPKKEVEEEETTKTKSAPVMKKLNIPKANTVSVPKKEVESTDTDDKTDEPSHVANPMAKRLSKEEAMRLLSEDED